MTMATPVVAWTVYAQSTNDNKVSFTLPDPLPDGVRMVAYCSTRSTWADQNKVALTGWTLLSRQAGGESDLTGSNNVGNISPAAVFQRTSNGDAGSTYTFQITGGGTTGARYGVAVLGITGHDPGAATVVAHAHNSSAGGAGGGGSVVAAAILFPSVTPPADASLLLWCGSNRTNEGSETRTPVEDGLGTQVVNNDVNAGLSVVVASGTSGETATGTRTWALDEGAARYWSFTVAVAGLEEEAPPDQEAPSITSYAMRPVTLCELRHPKCSHVYGTAPCTAAIGVTGADRCYNTLATCQDPENYDPSETVTLLFSDGSQGVPLAWGAIPSLVGARVKPTRLNIAGLDRNSGQLGLRAAASVQLRDHPDGDRLTDPYVEQRGYDPNTRGTFWPKWIARTGEEWGSIEVDILTGDLDDLELSPRYHDDFDADTSGEWTLGIEAVDGTKAVAGGKLRYTKGAGDGDRPRIVRAVNVKKGATYTVSIPAPTGTAARRELWVGTGSSGQYESAITPVVNNAALEATFTAPASVVHVVARAGTGSAAGETVEIESATIERTDFGLTRRAYFFETLNGPDGSGNVVLTARDILSRADGQEAQAPRPTTAVTTAEVLAGDTQIAATAVDAGEFPASDGTIRIGSELIRYATLTTPGDGSYIFNGCTRGSDGTTASAHGDDSTIQACLRFSGERPTTIIKTLLVDYADVPESWIDLPEWEAEEGRWLAPYLGLAEVVISKPEGVAELVADLCQSIMAYVWTDDRARRIRFRAVRPPEEDLVEVVDRLHVLPGAQARTVRIEEQVSAARVFHGVINATSDLDKEENYRRGTFRAGTQLGVPRVRDVLSRWLANRSQASLTARTLLGASNGLPVYIDATLGMNRLDAVTGSVVQLESRLLQDASGALEPSLFAVIEAEEDDPTELKLLLRSFGRFAPVSLYMASDAPAWGDATAEQRRRGGWYADSDGKLGGMPSGFVYS